MKPSFAVSLRLSRPWLSRAPGVVGVVARGWFTVGERGDAECGAEMRGLRVDVAARGALALLRPSPGAFRDRKSTRLNSSHLVISYAVFCLKKKKKTTHCTPCSWRSVEKNASIC